MFAQTDRRNGQGALCWQGCRSCYAAQIRYCKVNEIFTHIKKEYSSTPFFLSFNDLIRFRPCVPVS